MERQIAMTRVFDPSRTLIFGALIKPAQVQSTAT